jgi:hypothetical protein
LQAKAGQHQAEGFDEGGLADAGGAGQADAQGLGAGAEGVKQRQRLGPVIGPAAFDQRDRAGKRPAVTGADQAGAFLRVHQSSVPGLSAGCARPWRGAIFRRKIGASDAGACAR